MNTIGNNIKKFREFKGLSQDQVSEFLGINRVTLSNFETGAKLPDLNTLNKISDLFGIELDSLLEENVDLVELDTSFAFRTESLSPEDLVQISLFHKIVKNYLKIQAI